ncbi:MAG TPA: Nramp family divalent metal transporter [Polyangiaceae bacterium]|nr:Nramp family divalent metal transporter [Polyangiaceae bacterium]
MTSQPHEATLFHNLPSANGPRERAAGGYIRRRWLAFLGPATLVSVGYMDPGNWATDLEGGARFGYQLLWVLVLSNVMALLLQSLSAKLGIVAGMDVASACRRTVQASQRCVVGARRACHHRL